MTTGHQIRQASSMHQSIPSRPQQGPNTTDHSQARSFLQTCTLAQPFTFDTTTTRLHQPTPGMGSFQTQQHQRYNDPLQTPVSPPNALDYPQKLAVPQNHSLAYEEYLQAKTVLLFLHSQSTPLLLKVRHAINTAKDQRLRLQQSALGGIPRTHGATIIPKKSEETEKQQTSQIGIPPKSLEQPKDSISDKNSDNVTGDVATVAGKSTDKNDTATTTTTTPTTPHHIMTARQTLLLEVPSLSEDTPSAQLARQLLGLVPVPDPGPSVSLDPDLVKEASIQIRAVLMNLMEKTVSQITLLHKTQHGRGVMGTADNSATSQAVQLHQRMEREHEAIRKLTDERTQELKIAKADYQELLRRITSDEELIKALNLELGKLGEELPETKAVVAAIDREKQDRAVKQSITNLWNKIEDGLVRIKILDKNVTELRALHLSNEQRKFSKDILIKKIGTCLGKLQDDWFQTKNKNEEDETVKELKRKRAEDEDATIARLQQEKEELQELLEHEKGFGEQCAHSIMIASIQQLKTNRLRGK